jgi:hypothetical protein
MGQELYLPSSGLLPSKRFTFPQMEWVPFQIGSKSILKRLLIRPFLQKTLAASFVINFFALIGEEKIEKQFPRGHESALAHVLHDLHRGKRRKASRQWSAIRDKMQRQSFSTCVRSARFSAALRLS